MLGKLFTKGASEEKFWNWFVKNSKLIETIPGGNRDIADELLKQLRKYNKKLTYEIGTTASGLHEFVISCDSVREEIPFANILANTAPKIEGWTVVLFRRKKTIEKRLSYEGLEMTHEDILMEYTLYKDEVHLRLYIQNYYHGDQRYKTLANMFLERALGEFDVMTKVGAIEYVPDKKDMAGIEVITLQQLRDIVHDNLR